MWAADGQSLFFTGERDGRGEIYRVWLADKRVDRVTSGIDRAIMPATSPDGRYLAYAAQTIMSFQIHLLDLTNGSTRQITTGGGACRPSFRPTARSSPSCGSTRAVAARSGPRDRSARAARRQEALELLPGLLAGWPSDRVLGQPRASRGRRLGPGAHGRAEAGTVHPPDHRPRQRSRAGLAADRARCASRAPVARSGQARSRRSASFKPSMETSTSAAESAPRTLATTSTRARMRRRSRVA